MHSRINQTRLPGLQNKVGTVGLPGSGSALLSESLTCLLRAVVRPEAASTPPPVFVGSPPPEELLQRPQLPIRARPPGAAAGSFCSSVPPVVNASGGVTALQSRLFVRTQVSRISVSAKFNRNLRQIVANSQPNLRQVFLET